MIQRSFQKVPMGRLQRNSYTPWGPFWGAESIASLRQGGINQRKEVRIHQKVARKLSSFRWVGFAKPEKWSQQVADRKWAQ